MIKIENYETMGWEHAIRGCRNPMNSWEKSDSAPIMSYDHNGFLTQETGYMIGKNDLDLMKRLAVGGPVHAKYRRMITVYADITAPLYWWKEFDTYKVGTAVNSCSTMHKIHAKEFSLEDFSCEHLNRPSLKIFENMIKCMNDYREEFIKDKDKHNWWQMIQLLPSSYNQKRTVMMNYEVLSNMYHSRKNHKLDEWRDLCEWIKTLPYSEIITGEE